MQIRWKRLAIGGLASATLISGATVAAAAATSGPDRPATVRTTLGSAASQREPEVRHEPEARGRVAEGEPEREAGDELGRGANERADDAAENERQDEAGEDRGANSGPSVNAGPSVNSGPGNAGEDHSGPGNAGHDGNDDHGHDG